ncbi:hypothetical protein QR680_017528 [Steinernema hermaphroditum]|uniref:Uncharacterized protein n=1 Tax=Steinernema hermaphroditum TaxID=289476 RepID=A0AA39HEW3_9BILA|nr:hypothetical protein QR680_017528 [Steinernema hermaphroditum]
MVPGLLSVTMLPDADARTPEPPNKIAFESLVKRLNQEIKKVHKEIDEFWTEETSSSLKLIKEKRSNLERICSPLVENEGDLRSVVDDLRGRVNSLEDDISAMERDMFYKSEETALAKLAMLQEQYTNGKFCGIREEQSLVSQIDKIKRNVNKFRTYNSLKAAVGRHRHEMNTRRAELKGIRMEIRSEDSKIRRCKDDIRKILKPLHEKRRYIHDLYKSKRNTVEKYQRERHAYNDWRRFKRHHDGLELPPSCPNATNAGRDYDEFEPFSEQKRACCRLVNYFQFLIRQLDSVPKKQEGADADSSDSADELPPSFSSLKVTGMSAVHASRPRSLRKHASRANSNKPLSHNVDVIRLMALISLDIPYNLGQVPEALDKVRKELEYYENQTNIVDWTSIDFGSRGHEAPSASISLLSFPESDLDSLSPSASNLPSPRGTAADLCVQEAKSM